MSEEKSSSNEVDIEDSEKGYYKLSRKRIIFSAAIVAAISFALAYCYGTYSELNHLIARSLFWAIIGFVGWTVLIVFADALVQVNKEEKTEEEEE